MFFAGTYLSPESYGIYRFDLDTATGRLSGGELALAMPDVKYLAHSGDLLAGTYGDGQSAGVFLARRDDSGCTVIAQEAQGKVAPCYAAFFGERLITANYHEGTVYIYHCRGGTLERQTRIALGAGAGCHQVMRCGERLLVPCLERDRIALFDWKGDCAPIGEIPFPAGSGPRHGVVSADGKRLWVVGERDNRLYVFQVTDGGFSLERVADILPQGVPDGSLSAAIRLSPDGRFLTVSTRGANLLTTWRINESKLEQNQQISCGGDHPRDFLFSPDGNHLLCANRTSGEVVCFTRDAKTGRLGGIVDRIQIAQAVTLVCWEEFI